jgi:hypothetical protein
MPQDVFDDTEVSAMEQAIDQVLEGTGLTRHEVAHAVFSAASKSRAFGVAALVKMASETLAHRPHDSVHENK